MSIVDPRPAAPDGDSTEDPRASRIVGPFTKPHAAALAIAVVTVAALLYVLTLPVGTSAPRPTAPQGANFYRINSDQTGLEVGQRAPELATDTSPLVDLQGKTIRLSDYSGRPVWLVFFATWCPPCQQETPDLERAFEAHETDGLAMIGVDVQENAEIASGYARTYGLRYRIGIDADASTFDRYGVFGLPTHYFIDPDGIIRDRYFGPLTLDAMEAKIAALGKG